MKVIAFLFASLAVVSAFSPLSNSGRASTKLSESLFDKILGMDLFAPVKDQNNYGARAKKNIKLGTITENSYIPNGLTAAQYKKVRETEATKKAANYQRNVKKAGVFEDFTEFYTKRGTDLNASWRGVTNGHRMAKMKYDMDTNKEGKKYDGAKK